MRGLIPLLEDGLIWFTLFFIFFLHLGQDTPTLYFIGYTNHTLSIIDAGALFHGTLS
jgi:hypothetical protein